MNILEKRGNLTIKLFLGFSCLEAVLFGLSIVFRSIDEKSSQAVYLALGMLIVMVVSFSLFVAFMVFSYLFSKEVSHASMDDILKNSIINKMRIYKYGFIVFQMFYSVTTASFKNDVINLYISSTVRICVIFFIFISIRKLIKDTLK